MRTFAKSGVKFKYIHSTFLFKQKTKQHAVYAVNIILLMLSIYFSVLRIFANFRGLGHFRSFKTNYGFCTAGKDRIVVFTPNSKKILFMGCVIPAKTEEAK